jgi:hypothetical protein
MIRSTSAALLLSLFSLAACMRPSRDIEPVFVDPNYFAGATCRQLILKRARTLRALIFSGLTQDQYYRDDRTRTFGVPTPMATIFEESREGEISVIKGELMALNEQLWRMNCVLPDQ